MQPVAILASWGPAFATADFPIGRNRCQFSPRPRRGVSMWTRLPYRPHTGLYADSDDRPENHVDEDPATGSDSPSTEHSAPAACGPTEWPITFRGVAYRLEKQGKEIIVMNFPRV